MKTITIEIGELDNGSYPLRLCEFTAAGEKAELAAGAIPQDLKAPGASRDPATFREFVLTKVGSRPELREIGHDLLRLLTEGDAEQVGEVWSKLRKQAEPLRTLLEIEPISLRMLPWELICDDGPKRLFEGQRRPALSADRPFARSRSFRLEEIAEPFSWPLRALIVVASKDAAIKAEEELEQIEDALRHVRRTIDVEVLKFPSKAELLDEIGTKIFPHILHFIGHSGQNANPGREEMVLWLEHAQGRDFWTADEIENDLQGRDFLRFVFLNSCRSENAPSPEDQQRTLSIGEAFRNAGVPAVLAMQADVQGEHAGRLAGKIYEELSLGAPIDIALARGRNKVQEKMNDGLNCREWALPTLTLSMPPENVLPITRVSDQLKIERIKNCYKFREVDCFVNRKKERRSFLRSFYPIMPEFPQYQLLVVHGDSGMGKSWTAQWCMEGCAWQDHNVRYIEVVSNQPKDWLDVLLQIRDGDEDEKQFSPLHEPLNPEAFRLFNWELNHRLQGATPPVWEGRPDQIIDPPQKGNRKVDDLTSSNKDFVKLTFDSFRQALQQAAGDKPLILVLDHFTRTPFSLEPASMTAMIRELINPVAAGKLKPVKLVMIMTDDEFFRDYKIEDTLKAPFVEVPVSLLEDDKFDELATEFLKLHGPEQLDEIGRFVIKQRAANIKQWKPTELKDLYELCQMIRQKVGQ